MALAATGSARDRLLKAADELFYADGVHTIGIDRIIERAGVAKASLYSAFGSKEELVRTYLSERDRRLRERTELRLSRIESPRARILAFFDGLVERMSEGGYAGCAFMRACAEGPRGPSVSREVASAHRAWRNGFFAAQARELGVADPVEASRQLSLLCDGAAAGVSMEGDLAIARAAQKAAECLLDHFPRATPRSKRASARKSAKK